MTIINFKDDGIDFTKNSFLNIINRQLYIFSGAL